MPEVMRSRRTSLNLSQADLAQHAGVDKRQIRRYEAGEAQPSLPVARLIAEALDVTLDELAGNHGTRVGLSGQWWASWQTQNNDTPAFATQPVTLRQRDDLVQIHADRRGLALPEGGYTWRGELRLWDNQVLMGWYIADEAGVRSMGTLFMRLHTHGQHMIGRWVGQSHDGPMLTGYGVIARDEQLAAEQLRHLVEEGMTHD